MTQAQMNKSLRALSKTFAFQALRQFVDQKRTEMAIQLLSMDLSSSEASKLQGRPLGMDQLLLEIENIPDAGEDDES